MLTRRLLLAALSAAGLLSLAEPAAAAETVLKFHRWLPAQHPIMALTVQPWAEQVANVTGGRVKIEFTAAPLGPPPGQFDMVRDRVIDLALSVHGYTPARFVTPQIAELPFLADNSEPLSVALWRVHEKHFKQIEEYPGVKLLTMFASRPGRLWIANKPVRSAEDWQGLKVMGGSSINVEISKALGAVPVQAPGPQAAELLRKGVVDAAFLDHSSFKDFHLDKVVSHVTDFPQGIYAVTFYIIVNADKWASIAPADRAAIEAISGEALARVAGRNWDAEAEKAKALMRKAGVQVHMVEGEHLSVLRTKLSGLEKAWLDRAAAKSLDGKAALADLRAIIAEHEKGKQ